MRTNINFTFYQSIVLSSALLIPCGKAYSKTEKPNIIFIIADDLGYGDISAFNENSKIRTENIDKLCENGIKFTDAHSSSSVSTPSRYGILTGRYAFRTHLKSEVLSGFSPPLIDVDRNTMGTMLSKQGYHTACIGKWHLGWDWAFDENKEVDFSKPIKNGPTTRGFDYFYGIAASLDMSPYVYVENDRVTALPNRIARKYDGILLQRKGPQGADFEHIDCLPNFSKRALDYIAAQSDADAPFFLYLPLTAPHTPILPTKEFQGKSGLSPYGDFVLMIDNLVGEIVSVLKKKGQLDNTIIVFTSDNGCAPYADIKGMEKAGHVPNYIYRGAKADLYDGGHRLPLIMSWGNRFYKREVSDLFSLTDFYATFAEITGYKLKDNEAEDSFSIWKFLEGKGKFKRKDLVHHSVDGSFSIRTPEWKLLFCPHSGGWSYPRKNEENISRFPPHQLYNMTTDVIEQQNIEDQHPDLIKKYSRIMRKYILNGRSTPGKKQSNETEGEWDQIKLFMK